LHCAATSQPSVPAFIQITIHESSTLNRLILLLRLNRIQQFQMFGQTNLVTNVCKMSDIEFGQNIRNLTSTESLT